LLRKIGGDFDLIILDCLTLLVSNIMLKTGRAIQAEREVSRICGILRKTKLKAVIVSNEVGLGIVPDNPLARQFRDTAGRVNQTVARFADEVVLMFCGLPMRLNKDNE
jgi:adenosylcobinamide kinase/adenosylcobinamide-phosphate guanylyltransferase